MHFSKPLLILALGAPLIAAQSDPGNITFPIAAEVEAVNLTFPNATAPSMSNTTFTNTTSNATSPFAPEAAANHAAATTAQSVAWLSVLVGGLCVFAFF
ncbi:hypothetical protein V1505DRAFT_376855 [Lipomyces doorenjongii]